MTVAHTPGEWDAVGAEVLAALAPVIERQAKAATDRIYFDLLTTTQDYLAENLRWNIASRLSAAEEGRRDEWKRAEAADALSAELLEALQLALPYVEDASDSASPADQDFIRAAIARATGEQPA